MRMSALVEKLRAGVVLDFAGQEYVPDVILADATMHAAAAEIERLRAALRNLIPMLDHNLPYFQSTKYKDAVEAAIAAVENQP